MCFYLILLVINTRCYSATRRFKMNKGKLSHDNNNSRIKRIIRYNTRNTERYSMKNDKNNLLSHNFCELINDCDTNHHLPFSIDVEGCSKVMFTHIEKIKISGNSYSLLFQIKHGFSYTHTRYMKYSLTHMKITTVSSVIFRRVMKNKNNIVIFQLS